jgi:ubiquinone/menaquinone biosynthesis C-methylase UbiE
MITPEEVTFAYRLMLGREPESQEIVKRYATEIADLNALRELFMSSGEFRERFESSFASKRFQRGFHGGNMIVELDATPEQLSALCTKTGSQWQHLGETEPYWSVITNENYLLSNFVQSQDSFYTSGEIEAKMLDAAFKRHQIEPRPDGRCLELGCGVGRVTGSLAKRYREVLAVDISAPHLKLARDSLQTKGMSNVQFEHLTQLSQIDNFGLLDLFYSKIVLQHNPPPVMGVLLRSLLKALTPGGVGLFQIPVYKANYKFLIDPYLRETNKTQMEVHFFPQAALFELITETNCKVCELYEDDAIGTAPSMLSNTLLVKKLQY